MKSFDAEMLLARYATLREALMAMMAMPLFRLAILPLLKMSAMMLMPLFRCADGARARSRAMVRSAAPRVKCDSA